MPVSPTNVELVRTASRLLVRELGFMGGSFAGTDLPPSAVHALIEIEARPGLAARELAELLCLEKSSVSRMLRKLIVSGFVEEHGNDNDGRAKRLCLSAEGLSRTAAIHAFADRQVTAALARLAPDQAQTVQGGLSLYAAALAGQVDECPQPVELVTGYQPTLIARITEMHAIYYARSAGLGLRFEAIVAEGLAGFCRRLGNSRNAIWSAVQHGRIVGSVAIDSEDLGRDVAHLRWFIIDDGVRGGGLGRRLLSAALAHVDAHGFAETRLWTFSGLSAARHLYESYGFVLAEEWLGDQWGKEVLEQRFVRAKPN